MATVSTSYPLRPSLQLSIPWCLQMPPPRKFGDALFGDFTFGGPAAYVTPVEALTGLYGPVVMRFRYEERTRKNNLVRDVTEAIQSCSVALDNDRAILRTAKFSIRGDLLPAQFNAADNCIAVFMEVMVNLIWIRYQIGLFYLDKPEKLRDSSYPAEQWEIDASDVSVLIWRALVQTVFKVPSGTLYSDSISSICGLIGLNYSIPSGYSVASDQLWGPGTSYGEIMDELAISQNWFTPYATNTGTITTSERIPPYSALPNVIYDSTSEPRFILDVPDRSFREGVDRTQHPNRIAIVVDDPYRAPFFALRQNDDPQSPISTVIIGQTIHEEKALPRMIDSTIAGQFAQYRLLIEDADSQPVTIQTILDPRRMEHETYRVTFENAVTQQLYNVRSWSMKLEPGSSMEHQIRKAREVLISAPSAPVPVA